MGLERMFRSGMAPVWGGAGTDHFHSPVDLIHCMYSLTIKHLEKTKEKGKKQYCAQVGHHSPPLPNPP